jgi:hypothetical protein
MPCIPGSIPECRANTKASVKHEVFFVLSLIISTSSGYVQGGSDGMPILGDFAVKYHQFAKELGVPMDDLYQALVDTAENTVRAILQSLGVKPAHFPIC